MHEEDKILPPAEVEFGHSWAQPYEYWNIECGKWNYKLMADMLDYYGITKFWSDGMDYCEENGRDYAFIRYKGIATKNYE